MNGQREIFILVVCAIASLFLWFDCIKNDIYTMEQWEEELSNTFHNE